MLDKAPATTEITHVVWFEKLRRADVAQVGGKNSSLGEMVQTLSARGVQRSAGLRHHRRRLPQLHRRERPAGADGRSPRPACRRHGDAGRNRRRGPCGIPPRQVAEGDRGGDQVCLPRSVQARRGQGDSTSPCVPAPRPRTCPTQALPASRRPSSTSAARATCSMPAGAATPRCSPTVPSATAR